MHKTLISHALGGAVSAAFAACAALAALATPAAPAQAATVAITNATIYTADTAGVISGGTLLMRDDRIVAVGKNIAIPAGASIIDATGKILTPGFFAPLSGFGVTEVDGVSETNDRGAGHKRYSAALDMADAYNPRSLRIPIARIEGVTRALASPISRKGGSVFSGQGVVVSLGSTERWLVKPQAAMFAQFGEEGAQLSGSRASAVLALREAFEEVRSAGKAMLRPNVESTLTALDVAALKPVLAGLEPLVISANRASDITAALQLADQYKLKLIISGGDEAWLVAAQLAQRKVPVILDPQSVLPAEFESLGARADNARLLMQAGVTVVFSDDKTASYNPRNLRQLAGNAIANGVEPQAALAAVTLNPARLYGVDKQLGSLAAGKLADVVVWDGDPFELASYPSAVFIGGERMSTITRQTELRDRYMQMLKLR
jgi:imidazolonepropionase-like amidohydrolase